VPSQDVLGIRVQVVGGRDEFAHRFGDERVIADIARLIVGWETPSDSPISAWVRLCRM